MRYERTDLAVGAVVLGAVALALLSMGALVPNLHSVGDPLYTEVAQLDGVSVQTPVYLNGYEIGRVDRIDPELGGDGALNFRLRLRVHWTTDDGVRLPLRQGLRARLVPPPVTVLGAATITLEQVGPPGPPLHSGASLPSVRTAPLIDQMQSLTDSVTRDLRLTLASARGMLASADRAIGEATATAHTAGEVAQTTRDQLPILVTSLTRELALVDSTVREVRAVSPMSVAALDSVQRLVGDSRATLSRLNGLVDQHTPELSRMLASLDTTALLLQNFTRQVSEKPMRALTGVSLPPDFRRRPPAARQAGTPRPD